MLRTYQQEAVDATYRYLENHTGNPCIVIPTAGGKTWVLAAICRDVVQWGGRALILAHVKELLEQNAEKLRLIDEELAPKVGIYSAGLNSRDTEHPVIVAGIQSVYKRAEELGAFSVVIVDECHLLTPEGEGMYRTLLAEMLEINPRMRVIGLTATPYRTGSGMICGKDHILNAICYEISIPDLIAQGYLCPLISKAGAEKPDTNTLHVRAGEFVPAEMQEMMGDDMLLRSACQEIVDYTKGRKACLIFCAGVQHAQQVKDHMRLRHNIECGLITGDTPSGERAETIERIKGNTVQDGMFDTKPPLKYLVNVQVLTTGFDAPNIDTVVLFRPTMSPGLYYQMVGRGFRIHPEKENCVILDYGGNIMRHGPVDLIKIKDPSGLRSMPAPVKECPKCHSIIAAGCVVCPDCGHEMPRDPSGTGQDGSASNAGVLAGQFMDTEYEIDYVSYVVHTKRNAEEGAPKTMRVDYGHKDDLFGVSSEWLCFDHTGFARNKAVAWWKQRSNAPVPGSVREAIALAHAGALATTTRIIVRKIAGEKFPRIINYMIDPIPAEGSYETPVIDPIETVGYDDEPDNLLAEDPFEVSDDFVTSDMYGLDPDDDIPF